MANKVLFLTLRVFSATGGIEKVCRIMGKALYELGLQYGGQVNIFALYGHSRFTDGNKYFPQQIIRGFNFKRIRFVLASLAAGRTSNVILLSHINLLLVGYLIKLIKPSARLILLAHGIEVWKPLPAWKRYILNRCDGILAVSTYTAKRTQMLHGMDAAKITVINNCLDPLLEKPLTADAADTLKQRYGLQNGQPVLLSVSRMVETEKYKGYDKVLAILPKLIKTHPALKYLLVGKYDENEKKRLDELVLASGIRDHVLFTGFVPDEEMAAHFGLADVFVMPSEKEGFGIVFIEAMFYGIPVIAGNKDGSTDALLHGELGTLVDTDEAGALLQAIQNILNKRAAYLPNEGKLMEHFSYKGYKRRIREVVRD